MRRLIKNQYTLLLLISACLLSFIVWDNMRIKIVEETIELEGFPSGINEFTIVQISDLHEKEFGKNQKRLIKKINKINYDALVLTGDLLDNPKSKNYDPVYSLLEGIDNKENILLVAGNADPPSYQLEPSFKKSDFINKLEKWGARFLESYDTIKIANEQIHFVNLELAIIKNPDQIGKINGSFHDIHANEQAYLLYQKKLWQDMLDRDILGSEDIVIALNHYPVVDKRVDYIKKDPATEWVNFDLIIAGHYHGGQIRFPFLGALFVPEPWYEPNSFFPPQDRVKGLFEYAETKQYISAGLGTSDAIPLLKFRLFNPPEINVLTLKSK